MEEKEIIIKIKATDQPFASCDNCNRITTLDRYKYNNKTFCEACLEVELGLTMDEISYQEE